MKLSLRQLAIVNWTMQGFVAVMAIVNTLLATNNYHLGNTWSGVLGTVAASACFFELGYFSHQYWWRIKRDKIHGR